MARKEPHEKDQHIEGELPENLTKFLADLLIEVKNDDNDRERWKRKLIIANNQRLGIKRVSSRPYAGAPNIPLPEADKLIRKNKPNYVLSPYLPSKKAFVRPAEGIQITDEIKAKADKAEKGLNHVLNNKIDLFNVFDLGSDNFLEKGHAIFKVIERFNKRIVHKVIDLEDFKDERVKQLKALKNKELKQFLSDRFTLNLDDDDDKKIIDDIVEQLRSGKEVIRFSMPVIESFPDILVRPPERVYPAIFTIDIGKAEHITDEFFLTRREILENIENKIYRKEIKPIIKELQIQGKGKTVSSSDLADHHKNRNEGITEETANDLFRIKEISTYWQPKEDGPFERWVFVFLAEGGSVERSLLQRIRYPYELESWNYVKHNNEVKDERYYSSRGIPERNRALQEFMEKSINQLLIRDEINNAPLYTVLSNSSIQASSIRFIPGQKIKVNSHNEIRRLDDINKVDVSSERIVSLLKAFAEENESSTDQLFRNATNKGGGKTLGEIQQGIQLASGPATLNVTRWFIMLKKLYTMVFELLKERVGESMFIDGVEITREDFNFEADVIPNGSIDLAESNLRRGKAQARLQVTMSLTPDIVNSEDKYNAAFDFYEADGVRDPNRYITRPEIIAQAQKEQLKQEDQVLAEQEKGLDQEIAQTSQQAGEAEQRGQAKPAQGA